MVTVWSSCLWLQIRLLIPQLAHPPVGHTLCRVLRVRKCLKPTPCRTECCWERQCTAGPEHSCMCLMDASRRRDPDCSLPGAASSHASGGNVSPRQRSGLLPIIARAVNPLSLVFLSWNVVHGMCYMLPQCVL